MKKTMKRITAVFLALALLAGMASMFSVGASAAEEPLTVHVTCDEALRQYFGDAQINIDSGVGLVTVTYYINTPDYKITNCEWSLTYDSGKLTPDFSTDGLNFDYDDEGEKVYKLLRFSNGLDGQIVNEYSENLSDPSRNIGAMIGNITDPSGFATSADKKREFFKVTFRINDNALGTAVVNLHLQTMQAFEKGLNALSAQNLVKQGLPTQAMDDILSTEEYAPTADPLSLPELKYTLSIVLQDEIKIKLRVRNVPAETSLDDYDVSVTYMDDTRTSADDPTLALTSNTENVLTLAYCAAPEMTETAHLDIRWKGILIKSSDYSVRNYCVKLITGNYEEKFKELCRAALSYGASAQLFFGRNTDDLANADPEGVSLGCTPATTEVPSDYRCNPTIAGGFDRDIVSTSYSLVLNDKMEINVKVVAKTDTDGQPLADPADYKITATGTTNIREYPLDNGGKCMKIFGISPTELADKYNVKITAPNGGTRTYNNLCALSYAYAQQLTQDQNLKQICLELYNYYLKAKACFS